MDGLNQMGAWVTAGPTIMAPRGNKAIQNFIGQAH